jgi:hypothetical protein
MLSVVLMGLSSCSKSPESSLSSDLGNVEEVSFESENLITYEQINITPGAEWDSIVNNGCLLNYQVTNQPNNIYYFELKMSENFSFRSLNLEESISIKDSLKNKIESEYRHLSDDMMFHFVAPGVFNFIE